MTQGWEGYIYYQLTIIITFSSLFLSIYYTAEKMSHVDVNRGYRLLQFTRPAASCLTSDSIKSKYCVLTVNAWPALQGVVYKWSWNIFKIQPPIFIWLFLRNKNVCHQTSICPFIIPFKCFICLFLIIIFKFSQKKLTVVTSLMAFSCNSLIFSTKKGATPKVEIWNQINTHHFNILGYVCIS